MVLAALMAHADVWLSSENGRLLRIERRFINVSFADNQPGITVGTTLEIFDYNSRRLSQRKGRLIHKARPSPFPNRANVMEPGQQS